MRRRVWVVLLAWGFLIASGGWAFTTFLDRRAPAQNSPEVGFVRDMYTHHQQAVTMSLLVLQHTDDPAVTTLAHEVASGQAEEMGMMLEWSRANDVPPVDDSWRSMEWMAGSPQAAEHGHAGAGSSPSTIAPDVTQMGMATDEQLTELAQVDGRPAERLFLELMLRHHEGGLAMTEAFLDRGTDGRLRELAGGIVASQEYQVRLMNELLEQRA